MRRDGDEEENEAAAWTEDDLDQIHFADFALCRFMRWHYDALLGLPLSVYVALLAWAQEQTKQSQLDLDELE